MKIYHTGVLRPSRRNIAKSAELILRGDPIAVPTETVYGLAVNAYNPEAIQTIFAIKGRPQDNPLIVHISSMEMFKELTTADYPIIQRLAEAFWPGALTMVLPKSARVPDEVTAGLDTVAIRYPSNPIINLLIQEAGVPLAAPSANQSGRPSPTLAKHVYHDLAGKVPIILDGLKATIGVESTVIAVSPSKVKLLRPGAITIPMLEEVCGEVEVDEAVFHQVEEGKPTVSPGMKYKHYSPKAQIVLVKGSLEQFANYVNARLEDRVFALVFNGEEEALECISFCYGGNGKERARDLFLYLRKMDDFKAKTVYVRCPPAEGLDLAVYNRLLRASGFDVRDASKDS